MTNLKEPLIKYRITPNSVSQSKRGKQELFAHKAREFYQQRIKYGRDEYTQFNLEEILNIDVERTINKIILESEIKSSFKINNFSRTRKLTKKYFHNFGYFIWTYYPLQIEILF